MVKEKVTITLDRAKAERARSLVGARSTSELVDRALDRLIRAERIRQDMAAYQHRPPTDEEAELARSVEWFDLDDETDWESLYPDDA